MVKQYHYTNLFRLYRLQIVQKNLENAPLLPFNRGKDLVPLLSRKNDQLISRLGISSKDILFKETSIMAIASDSKSGIEGETYADTFLTYGLRKYQGIMVEESFFKIYQKNTKMFEGLELSWPKITFHPQMKNFIIKDKRTLLHEVQKKISSTQVKKGKINVRMAVVLRPVQLRANSPVVFLPSLKVGVHSSTGEAGNMFYVDLTKSKFNYLNQNMRDKAVASR